MTRPLVVLVLALGIPACRREDPPPPRKDPPTSPDAPVACATDADCRMDRCAGCTCRVAGKSQPACEATPCAADPCGRSKAACRDGACVLVSAPR